MAEASVAVTAGAGTLLHTNTRSIAAQTMHDEYTLPGEFAYASYAVTVQSVSGATANSHMLQIMAGASNPVRIRGWRMRMGSTPAAAVSLFGMQLLRLTTAGTGGTAVTPAKLDTADGAAGATAMTLPTVKGTESTQLDGYTFLSSTTAIPSSTASEWSWSQHPSLKPIIIPAGAANGVCFKNPGGLAAATWDFTVWIVETAFV